MAKIKVLLSSLALAAAIVGSASAATLNGVSSIGFTLQILFNDDNGNGKLDLIEFDGWASNFGSETTYPVLAYIGGGPAISPYAVPGGVNRSGFNFDLAFDDTAVPTPGQNGLTAGSWSWSVDLSDPAAMPVPASGMLLLTGLAGLALSRRSRR